MDRRTAQWTSQESEHLRYSAHRVMLLRPPAWPPDPGTPPPPDRLPPMTLRRLLPLLVVSGVALALTACATLQRGPVGNPSVPQPARTVDLNRYAGLWYEIGRYENGFERGCEGVTALYTVRDDGLVGVRNPAARAASRARNGRSRAGRRSFPTAAAPSSRCPSSDPSSSATTGSWTGRKTIPGRSSASRPAATSGFSAARPSRPPRFARRS